MNKSFLAIYISFCLIIACVVLLPNKSLAFSNANISDDARYIFHVIDIPQEVKNLEVEIIQNGNEYIVKCNKDIAKEIKPKFTQVLGESVTFECSKQNALKLISEMKCNLIELENINGLYTYYGYSNNIDNYTYVNNQKVNVELAYSNGRVTIGSPIILGDY